VTFDLYAWKAPRDLDADGAAALVQRWNDEGADPAASAFEPSEDVGWFHRELKNEGLPLELVSDANPNPSTKPAWLSGGDDEPPARLVAIRLTPETTGEEVNDVFSFAVKYDLVLFDARSGSVHFPMQEMADYASATFWPGGAVQAAVAGGFGLVLAIVGWFLPIPIVGWILIVVGGFMFVMAVFTFVHEGRKALRSRGARGDTPPG
jgi:hypothetical protein